MARTGKSYPVILKETYINWGEFRYTDSRAKRSLEGYLPIPAWFAKENDILNGNGVTCDTIGMNLFYVVDEFENELGIVKTQGCSRAGEIYAKQFAISGDLTGLGKWFVDKNLNVGDEIIVKWITEDTIQLTKL